MSALKTCSSKATVKIHETSRSAFKRSVFLEEDENLSRSGVITKTWTIPHLRTASTTCQGLSWEPLDLQHGMPATKVFEIMVTKAWFVFEDEPSRTAVTPSQE